jgi:hypothetical protein
MGMVAEDLSYHPSHESAGQSLVAARLSSKLPRFWRTIAIVSSIIYS